jgi:hypothetical protein
MARTGRAIGALSRPLRFPTFHALRSSNAATAWGRCATTFKTAGKTGRPETTIKDE